MLRRLFGGRNDKARVKYAAGTDVEVAPVLYAEEIEAHFDRIFPGRTTSVFHEIVSDIVHIDVHFMEPTDEDPVRVLHTTGMSDLPMTIPAALKKERQSLERAELVIILPGSWPIDSGALEDERHYWPVRLLKQLARYPHEYHSWLGHGHTVQNSDGEPYAEDIKFNGAVLSALKGEIGLIPTRDRSLINVYGVVPLYQEEMDFKRQFGIEPLFEKLSEVEEGMFLVNPSRKNVCANGTETGRHPDL